MQRHAAAADDAGKRRRRTWSRQWRCAPDHASPATDRAVPWRCVPRPCQVLPPSACHRASSIAGPLRGQLLDPLQIVLRAAPDRPGRGRLDLRNFHPRRSCCVAAPAGLTLRSWLWIAFFDLIAFIGLGHDDVAGDARLPASLPESAGSPVIGGRPLKVCLTAGWTSTRTTWGASGALTWAAPAQSSACRPAHRPGPADQSQSLHL